MTTTNANANNHGAAPLYVAKLTLGLEYDREGKPLPKAIANSRVLQIKEKLNRWFGGCSVYFGYGSWLDDYGTVVSEQIVTFVVYVPRHHASTKAVEALAHSAGQCLEQQSVAIEQHGNAQLLDVDYSEHYRRLPDDWTAYAPPAASDDALDDDPGYFMEQYSDDDDPGSDDDLQDDLSKMIEKVWLEDRMNNC